MILKIVAIIFVLTGIFLYIVVRASSRSVGEDMQKSLDEEQAKVVAELSNRSHSGKKQGKNEQENIRL